MLKKLLVAAAILALAAPVFALGTSKDGIVTSEHATNPVEQSGVRADVEFNTGGAMNLVPDALGSATGWAYFSAHNYTNGGAAALGLIDMAFPTCENSTDPIALPVLWFVHASTGDIVADIGDPYMATFDHSGTFYPTNAMDSLAGDLVYDAVDASGYSLAVGASMWWGYENAGLQGMTSYVVEQTFGYWVSFWDDDTAYGRTALMQFTGDYGTTATEAATMSQVKSLY